MKWRFWTFALGLTTTIGVLPAYAGGAGPLEIGEVRGRVEIKPLTRAEYWNASGRRARYGPFGPVGKWRPAKSGEIAGRYLLRTGPRSHVYLNGANWCVDPNSLLRIESEADYGIVVLRGQVSAADGKRGKSLFREYRSDSRSGVIR